MPGFNMGTGGDSSQQKNATAETRRKHRWIFTKIGDILAQQDLLYLKTAQRPSFKLDEVVMHHDQEEAWFAGKQHWEPLSFSWYDAEQNPDVSARIWAWLNSVVPTLQERESATCVSAPATYKKQAELRLTGNCDGNNEEQWKFFGLWPKEVNWQELDYESTDILLIDVVARYDRALRKR